MKTSQRMLFMATSVLLAIPFVYLLKRSTVAQAHHENVRYDLDKYLTSLGL